MNAEDRLAVPTTLLRCCVEMMNSDRKPTIPEVVPFVVAWAGMDGNQWCGGNLHVVLDEGNVTDGNIEDCADWAMERRDPVSVALLGVLFFMSTTQRRKLAAMYWKLCEDAGLHKV